MLGVTIPNVEEAIFVSFSPIVYCENMTYLWPATLTLTFQYEGHQTKQQLKFVSSLLEIEISLSLPSISSISPYWSSLSL